MPRILRAGALPVLLYSLLAVRESGAQDPSVITETEYLSTFGCQHPAVVESSEALARAEAATRRAVTLENPTLDLLREDPSGPVRQLDVVATWKLPDPSRRSEVKARGSEADAARANLEIEITRHRLAMRQAYADWAVADARQEILEDQVERVEALARRVADRVEKGEASGLESRRLTLAAETLRSRLALVTSEAVRARAEAHAWAPELPSSALPKLPALSEPQASHGEHSRVRAAEAELAAAQWTRESTGQFLRSPALSLGWQRQELGPESVDGPVLGLAWSLPLFDRKQAAREASDAGVRAARARLERARHEVRLQREAARDSFTGLRAALARAHEELASSELMLGGAEAAFRVGEAGLTDLLEIYRAHVEAELATIDLHQAALAASRVLERLASGNGANPTDDDGATSPSF